MKETRVGQGREGRGRGVCLGGHSRSGAEPGVREGEGGRGRRGVGGWGGGPPTAEGEVYTLSTKPKATAV